jgi:hypothetical protein
MAYDVSEHVLLSPVAQELADDVFEEQQAWAEDLLGISGTSYTGQNKRRVERYLAMQINWQLQLPKGIWYTKQVSSSQSKQNVTYRDGILLVDPAAAAGIALVEKDEEIESRYGDMRAIR